MLGLKAGATTPSLFTLLKLFFTFIRIRGRSEASSPGSSSTLCLICVSFLANAATLGLPSTALDVPYPREPVHVGALERVAGSEPVTATILPQLSTGTGTNSTVRLLDWTGVSAPLPGSGMRVSLHKDWQLQGGATGLEGGA